MSSEIYSGVGMPDSGVINLVPAGVAQPMRVRWADVSAWSVAPWKPEPSDRPWLVLWLHGGKVLWFGTKEPFFKEGEDL